MIDGAATGGIWVQGLVQKGQEGESGGVNALAAVVARLVGLEQEGVQALGTEALPVVERTAAPGEAGVLEGEWNLPKRGAVVNIYQYYYRYIR